MINNKFLYFKTENAFLDSLQSKREIKEDSIVFIEDKRAIWTHGHMFGGQGEHAKGFFNSVESLPEGNTGDWAIVRVGDDWYMFAYNNGWQQGEKYEFSDTTDINMDEIYVRKDQIREFIRNLYDDIYVKKSEVYTPDDWNSGGGSSSSGSGSGSGTGSEGGLVYAIDSELNSTSINPVSNYVIYNALKGFVKESDLQDRFATQQQVQDIVDTAISEADLENYYTKSEVYSKGEIDQNTYTRNYIDNKVANLEELIRNAGLSIRVVEELPSNPQEKILYMVQDEETNQYTMWVWQDNRWVEFGRYEFNIDLSEYLSKAEFESYMGVNGQIHDIIATDVHNIVDPLINPLTSKDYVASAIQASETQTQSKINAAVANKVDWDDVYTPQTVAPTSTIDAPGKDPWSNRASSRAQATYVTYADLESLVEMIGTGNGTINVPKHVILEEAAYNELTTYAPNTLYFVLEPQEEQEETNWTFGGTFPITFGVNGIGTFPITLT